MTDFNTRQIYMPKIYSINFISIALAHCHKVAKQISTVDIDIDLIP